MFSRLWRKVNGLRTAMESMAIASRRACYEELRNSRRSSDPLSPSGYAYKVYSQSDEDGITAEIFRRIGTDSRVFVEFGVGDGLENNTVSLLLSGWSGLWIEGDPRLCGVIRGGFPGLLGSGRLKLINSFVTPENIDGLIVGSLATTQVDLLSVDIDGNDAHVLSHITSIRPRVVIVEYNAKFGPSIDYCMPYKADHAWRKSDTFGASLKHFERLLGGRGYSLVCCNVVGTNAFFVRQDLVGGHFGTVFTAEHRFEPARYELVGLPAGHPARHLTIDGAVRNSPDP